MEQPFVLDVNGFIALIEMQKDRMNTLDDYFLDEFQKIWSRLEERNDVRVVILSGNEKYFSVGADLKKFREMTISDAKRFVEFGHRVLRRIADSRIVSIAAIRGFALGGGAELAVACDLRVAGETSVLGFPEVGLGLFPGWGGTQRAARLLGGGRAKLLMLTGMRLTGREAYEAGLVERVVDDDRVVDEARAVATAIVSGSPSAAEKIKFLINETQESPLSSGLLLEQETWIANFAHGDWKEGVQAFLEKRRPEW